jgi:hypothetical protein
MNNQLQVVIRGLAGARPTEESAALHAVVLAQLPRPSAVAQFKPHTIRALQPSSETLNAANVSIIHVQPKNVAPASSLEQLRWPDMVVD